MIGVLTGLSLILQVQNVLSQSGDVLDWTAVGQGKTYTFPQFEGVEPRSFEIKSTTGKTTYKLVCQWASDKNPKVEIYTSDGIFIEWVIINDFGAESCNEEYVTKLILADDNVNEADGGLKLVFVTSVISKSCSYRMYKINIWDFIAVVDHSEDRGYNCPSEVAESLSVFNGVKPTYIHNYIGVVSMSLTSGSIVTMDYTRDLVKRGSQDILEIPINSLLEIGKPYHLICQEDTLDKEDPKTGKSSILTGYIEFEYERTPERVRIERFKLAACSSDSVTISEVKKTPKTRGDIYHITIVFKTGLNTCYRREYVAEGFFVTNFNSVSVARLPPKKVWCSKYFRSDSKASWWRRLLHALFWWWVLT